MFVLAHVSSMKTSRAGSTRPCRRFQRSRLRAMSRRSCSDGSRLFFEGDAFRGKQLPHRPQTDGHAARGQLAPDRLQGQIGLFFDPREKPCTLVSQDGTPHPTHRLRRGAPRAALPLRPFHHAGRADPEQLGNRAAAQPVSHRRRNALTQVIGIRTRHACWPPPSHQIESEIRPLRNPQIQAGPKML